MAANKKVLMAILGKPAGGATKPEEEGGEAMGDSHTEAAAEVMDALKAGDVEGFASALRSFVDMCRYSEE